MMYFNVSLDLPTWTLMIYVFSKGRFSDMSTLKYFVNGIGSGFEMVTVTSYYV